jgi:allophanate hydrolase
MTESGTALLIDELLDGYRRRRLTPSGLAEQVQERIAAEPERHLWITRLSAEQVSAYSRKLEERSSGELPLYGVPFAIKDNIDLAGVPTTCACPDYAYVPQSSAFVVQRLIDAGAIPLGKTNLDQFATGLVGMRSPYGACANAFDPEYICGGSSCGSALAVATGLVSFALGTDTAGSGRVPAAFNNVIGLKPSRGLISARGVVPACRSLDCVSIFALCAGDAARVLSAAAGFDAEDPYSRRLQASPPAAQRAARTSFRFGVPRSEQLEFFGDAHSAKSYAEALARLEKLGGRALEIDFGPLFEAGRLLYEGPWIAERYAALGPFIESNPDALQPVTRSILAAGARVSAADAFRAQYRLRALQRESESLWSELDFLVAPTAPTLYRIAEVEAEPLRLNANLGCYSSFVNLLDLAAVAVPSGVRGDGLPFGITLAGPAGTDFALLVLADRLHRASDPGLGALRIPLPKDLPDVKPPHEDWIALAVCGAHMRELPLNHQLTERGSVLLRSARTAPRYRFYALPGGPPERPGLARVSERGAAIDLEIWAIPSEQFGSFVASIPAPLGIGKIELEDGSSVAGFLCEAYALAPATDITSFGGWRAYLARPGGTHPAAR